MTKTKQANLHLARGHDDGYASRYATEDFTIVEIEKSFIGNIRNPTRGRCSQTFVMAGKADAIVSVPMVCTWSSTRRPASIDSTTTGQAVD